MKIRDYYDRTARERTPNYQESSALMDALVHRPNERFVRREVRRNIQGAESIADLGCGTGEHLSAELPRLKRLFLNDLSGAMLEDTTRRLRSSHAGIDIDSYLGSIETIPDQARPCEVAICLGVLNHFEPEPLGRALRTLARLADKTIVLYYAHEAFLLAARVGGTFRGMGIHYRAIERSRVAAALEESGFVLARSAYAFRLPILSPLVIQVYRARPGTTAG